MSVTIQSEYGTVGTIDNDRITSDDQRLVLTLRTLQRSTDGLQYVPDADLYVANRYISEFGGRVVSTDGSETEGDPINRVY